MRVHSAMIRGGAGAVLLGLAGLAAPPAAADELDALFGPPPEENKAQQEQAGQAPGQRQQEEDADAAAPETVTLPEDEPAGTRAVARRRRVIEEIIVTAQKRRQSLAEVPISISALDGDFLDDNAITDFRDLSLYVPNARIDPNGTLPQVSIRGFNAAPLNRSFEQAISMVVDGVTYGTSVYFQTPIFDIERVEVLRGPQGTLFGKNSTAGAFNITTAPADGGPFTGRLSLQRGEIGRQRVEGGVGGTLIPGLLDVRLSILHSQRDGLLYNTTSEIVEMAIADYKRRERQAARLKLRFPDLLGMQLDLSAEYLDTAEWGLGGEIKMAAPDLVPIYRAYDPQFDDTPDNYITSVDVGEVTRIEGPTFVVNAQRHFGDWDLFAVLGRSQLDFYTLSDPDFSPAPMLEVDYEEFHPQDTVELRSSSPEFSGLFGFDGLGGRSRLTAGVFWQHRGFEDSFSRVRVDPTAAGLLLGTNRVGPPGLPLPPPPGGLAGNPGTNNREDDEIGTIYFEQQTRSKAGFGQMEWDFLPDWMLQLGMRYSVDDKLGTWDSVFEQGSGAILSAALGREEYQARRRRSESSFTPKLLLQHDFSEAANVYLGWVRGFRGGGFNAFASTTADLEYEEENVQSFEAGGKLRLLDGAASINLGLFWMNLTDFQVLTQDPSTAVFTVINAGEARARGLEADFLWLANQWLTLQGSVGINDSEFLEFPFGTCTIDNEDTDGDGDPRCDLSGEPLDFVSKYTATLSPRVNWQLPWRGWELVAGASAIYQSEYFADIAVRDPRVIEPESLRFNASLGLRHAASGLSLRAVGQNITDERVALFISDVPTVAGTFYQSLEPPRRLFAELVWNFD